MRQAEPTVSLIALTQLVHRKKAAHLDMQAENVIGNIRVPQMGKFPPLTNGWGKRKWSRAIESYFAYLKKLASVLVM